MSCMFLMEYMERGDFTHSEMRTRYVQIFFVELSNVKKCDGGSNINQSNLSL